MPQPEERAEPFQLLFGIKSSAEVVIGGIRGLLTVGRASKYNVVDSDGEYQVPGSFRDIGDSWGRQAKPLVMYQHGLDPILGTAPIGWGTKWDHDAEGLTAECFIPKEPNPPFTDNIAAKNKRYREIYEGIKARKIRHYSVGGIFMRVGKALMRWSMTELTITPAGSLGEDASFMLGTKAVKAFLDGYDGGPYMIDSGGESGGAGSGSTEGPSFEQSDIGHLNRDTFSAVMGHAQDAGDAALHDHLLYKPAEYQGSHDAETCPICDARRTQRGIKAKNPDGDYLLVDKTGQHIRVRKNGKLDHGLMGGAYAALTSNYRGNPYAGPDKAGLLAKLKKLYTSEGMDWPGDKGGGGKSEAPSPELVDDMLHTLAEIQAGTKVGRKLSAKTLAVLKMIEDTLASLLPDEGTPDPEEEVGVSG